MITGMRWFAWCLLVLLLVLGHAGFFTTMAQQPVESNGSEVESPDSSEDDLVNESSDNSQRESRTAFAGRLFARSGWVGLFIGAVAFVMLTLAIYNLITLRRGVYLPSEVLGGISECASKLDYNGIMHICRENSSLICRVLAAGLARRTQGYREMVDAMEETGRSEATRLHQNIGYLSLIGNVAPMMGLLGTVIGMMRSFHAVAEYAGNVQPGRLAEGIYEALTTTFMGLLVAIPALILFVCFRNRVVNLLDETAAVAEEVIFPLKNPGASRGTRTAGDATTTPGGGR